MAFATTAAASVLFAATFTRPLERVSSVDPAQSRSVYDAHAVGLVFETPLAIDYRARPYRVVDGFCRMPKVSSDGLTYVFRLARPGSPLTAADVVRSLERLRDPREASPNSWMMKDVDAISAPDPETVVITLKRRCHYFNWLMTMPAASVVGPDGEGTGPYELVHWIKNHEMRFERRKWKGGEVGKWRSGEVGKWRSEDGFDTIRYLVIDDVSTQWLMFLKGEVDFLGEISRDSWDAVVGADGRLDPRLAAQGVSLHAVDALDVGYVGINMRDPALGPNRRLRQALNAAFDGEAWERFCNGRVRRADGPVPPGVPWRLESPFAYSFDLEKAKRLLAEAGYPGGIDPNTGRRLALTLSVGRASQESREAAELMAAFYDRVGVRLEFDFKTWDAFLKATGEGRVQMFRMGWVGDYPDAQNFLQLFYSGNRAPGPNRAAYASAEYDREYEAALGAATEEERGRRWARCQEIVREDCPWVFTHFSRSYSLTRPTVGNYVPTDFPYGVERFYESRSESATAAACRTTSP